MASMLPVPRTPVAEPRFGKLVQLHPLKALNLYQYFFFIHFEPPQNITLHQL